ncbi:hypothetical protein V6N13_076912 [Hibiscus sabdariffa]
MAMKNVGKTEAKTAVSSFERFDRDSKVAVGSLKAVLVLEYPGCPCSRLRKMQQKFVICTATYLALAMA